MHDADRARVRRLIERIRSRRATDGAFSVFGRLRLEAIEAMAKSIAANYPTSNLDEEDLRRCALLFERQNAPAFQTSAQVATSLHRARHNDQRPHVIRDVTKEVLSKLTPTERLEWANSQTLPTRIILKGPNEE